MKRLVGVLSAFYIKVLNTPESLSDDDAPNNRIYYSTTQSRLVYKDPAGDIKYLTE